MSNNLLIDEPFMLAGLRLQSRIVRSAFEEKLVNEDGFVTGRLMSLFASLAAEGCGLIITGGALVHPSGRHSKSLISAHSDVYLEGLRSLVGKVRAGGGAVALQLTHGGPYCSPILLGGAEALAPSGANPYVDHPLHEMSTEEIWRLLDAYSTVSWRARAAGFDALHICASAGGLAGSFLSAEENLRGDYWGGDEERRSHFLEEALKAVREGAGAGVPVIVSLSPYGFPSVNDCARMAARLEHLGADAVELTHDSRSTAGGGPRRGPASGAPDPLLRAATKIVRAATSMPLILSPGSSQQDLIIEVLACGEADLVGVERPLKAIRPGGAED